jgi:hypothetical protein
MAVVAGVVFFVIRALLALIPVLTVYALADQIEQRTREVDRQQCSPK